MKKSLLILCGILFSGIIFGDTVGYIGQIEPAAAAAALGGICAVSRCDAFAIFHNPSLLSTCGRSFAFSHVSWLEGSGLESLSAQIKFKKDSLEKGSLGIGAQFFHAGSFIQRDMTGAAEGTAQLLENMVAAGYAGGKDFKRAGYLRFGGAVKVATLKMNEYTRARFAADVGAAFDTLINEYEEPLVTVGVSVRDIGSGYSFGDNVSSPLSIAVGFLCAGHNLINTFSYALSAQYIDYATAGYSELALGAECKLMKILSFRAGYKIGSPFPLTVGIGLNTAGDNRGSLFADLSYIPSSDWGGLFSVSFGIVL